MTRKKLWITFEQLKNNNFTNNPYWSLFKSNINNIV